MIFKKGYKQTEEHKRKISLALTGRKLSEEHIKNIISSHKRKHYSPKTEFKKGRPSTKPMLGKKQSEETKRKMRKSNPKYWLGKKRLDLRRKWQNKEFREKQIKAMMKGMIIKPNKPEKIMINLIKENNLPFNYVGDGQVIIDGFNPDFLSKNPKQIIELFGDYWHKKRPGILERDKRRLKTYKKYGYETLVIWEHELKNPNLVLNKIKRFI